VQVGDEIVNETGEIALVHIMLGDEAVAKKKDGSLLTFKLGSGDWLVFKSKLIEFKSVIDGLSVEQLQEQLAKLRSSRAGAVIKKGGLRARRQSEPALSKADKELMQKLKSLTPEQIKLLKARAGVA